MASNLSEKDVKNSFDAYDRDKSGHISFEELKAIFSKFGINVSDSSLQYLVNKYDQDESGQICFPEFYQLLTGKPYTGTAYEGQPKQQGGGNQGQKQGDWGQPQQGGWGNQGQQGGAQGGNSGQGQWGKGGSGGSNQWGHPKSSEQSNQWGGQGTTGQWGYDEK